MAVAEVRAPGGGLWRVARGDDPLAPPPRPPRSGLVTGNRFDALASGYDVVYFGSNLETCFGETLARFRPKPELLALVADEWEALGFMALGAVAADWRHRRTAVRVGVPEDCVFLDVEAVDTHQVLRKELAPALSTLGYDDLDVSTVRGPDRRITQLISEWAYGKDCYAGLRYVSRIKSGWECWAIFHETVATMEVIERRSVALDEESLLAVAKLFGLQVF